MIKKLIGIAVAAAVVAIIVVVSLRRDRFESMVRYDEVPKRSVPAAAAPAPSAVPAADSLAVGVADSI